MFNRQPICAKNISRCRTRWQMTFVEYYHINNYIFHFESRFHNTSLFWLSTVCQQVNFRFQSYICEVRSMYALHLKLIGKLLVVFLFVKLRFIHYHLQLRHCDRTPVKIGTFRRWITICCNIRWKGTFPRTYPHRLKPMYLSVPSTSGHGFAVKFYSSYFENRTDWLNWWCQKTQC